MATYISSQAMSGIQARAVHAGVNSVYSIYSLTATLSAGDIIQMCKLPNNARVLDVNLMTNVNPGANADTYCVGTRADATCLVSSATLSKNLSFRINQATGLGKVFTVSDDAVNRYSMIEISVPAFAGTGTKSGAISLNILYTIDQEKPS